MIKKYFLLFILSLLIMIYLLFPFGDIGDLVGSEIAKATQNKVQLQFEDMNLSLIPLGLKLSDVNVKTLVAPEVSSESISVYPSFLSLVSLGLFNKKIPQGRVSVEKIFNGDLNLKLAQAKASEKVKDRFNLEIEASQLSLNDLKKMIPGSSAEMDGLLSSKSSFDFDLNFQEPIDGVFNLKAEQLKFSSLSIPTPLGPLPLPSVNFKQILSAGKISNDQLNIEQFEFGDDKDELQGSLKGRIQLSLRPQDPRNPVQLGSYSLEVQIKAKNSLISKAATLIDIINGMIPPEAQKKTISGMEYRVKVSGERFGPPPQMETLR